MIRSVDLVLSGDDGNLLAVAVEALRAGQRLLVVMRSGDARAARRLRRALREAAVAGGGRVAVTMNAEIVCVDGVERVEAVVFRYARTGRVCAVNAFAMRSCVGSKDAAEEKP